jgi:RimJ/RimL family protein N-acetyltransferase
MSESHQTSAVIVEQLRNPCVSVRPLSATDRDGFAALFRRLSPESRRRRFLSPKPELSGRELAFLTEIDHVRHEALAAVDGCDGSILGVARYVEYPDRPATADVAVEVADDRQRAGIGRMLVEALVDRAQENDIEVLATTTLRENQAARALARRVGFVARGGNGAELELELVLAST